MLDALFNDAVTIRRLAGPRDGHGKATLMEVKDETGETPAIVECYVDRRRRNVRTFRDSSKSVDATLLYNVSLSAPIRLRDEDLVVLESTGETYKVDSMQETTSNAEGSEYAQVALTRVKAPAVAKDSYDVETL